MITWLGLPGRPVARLASRLAAFLAFWAARESRSMIATPTSRIAVLHRMSSVDQIPPAAGVDGVMSTGLEQLDRNGCTI